MSSPSLITVGANELEEILVVDLSDSDDDATEVEILYELMEENYKSIGWLKKTDPCREWS